VGHGASTFQSSDAPWKFTNTRCRVQWLLLDLGKPPYNSHSHPPNARYPWDSLKRFLLPLLTTLANNRATPRSQDQTLVRDLEQIATGRFLQSNLPWVQTTGEQQATARPLDVSSRKGAWWEGE
jgi:hypothetical protein